MHRMSLRKRVTRTPNIPPTECRAHGTNLEVLASDRLLRRYIEGWAEANATKIANAVTADYSFLDPLVGCFDRDTVQHYFAILRRRVGFDSVASQQRKICLDAFPTPQWPARKLRFWRSIPECGLAESPISKSPVHASTRRSWITTSTLPPSISGESQTRTPIGIVRSDHLRVLATAKEDWG